MDEGRHDFRPGPAQEKFGIPGINYPTPNSDDIIIIEDATVPVGKFRPPKKGTKHKQESRATLVFIGPVRGDTQNKTQRRIYATTRTEQDAYNHAITYIGESRANPAIVRTYIEPREGYVRKNDYTPDSVFATAVLTAEHSEPADDQLNSLYLKVTRVFEQLPGPALISRQHHPDLGPVIEARRVVKFDAANAGVATGSVVKSYAPRDGSSLVSIETTLTRASGPVRKGQRRDNQLGFVRPFTQQTQTYDDEATGAAALGNPLAEVIPTGPHEAQVTIENQAAVNTALAGIFISRPIKTNVRLPSVLFSITAVFNTSSGVGDSVSTGSGLSSGTNWSVSLSLPSRASSSISIVPDAPLGIRHYYGSDVPAREHQFYLQGDDITLAQILDRLSAQLGVTVYAWPVFKPETNTLTLAGKQVSISANATAHQSVSASGSNGSFSNGTDTGYSLETGGTTRSLVLEETLHGDITIADATKTATVAVSATSGWGAGVNFPALGASSPPAGISPVTTTAFISPDFLDATDPPTVPVANAYLNDYHVRTYDSVNSEVTAEVVDMAYFQSRPRRISYPINMGLGYAAVIGIVGVPLTPLAPLPGNGGVADSFSITPALPAGLMIHPSTGVISGTPTAAHLLQTHTVTCTNSAGSCTTEVKSQTDV